MGDLSFFNQSSEVDNESLVMDWFEPEDVVKVWIGVPPTPDREKRAGGRKNIRNLSGDEIILVAQTRKMKLPVFLKENEREALQFDSLAWTNKIELWRKDGEKYDEPIYKGRRYVLDMGDNIHHYTYDNDGLHVHHNTDTVGPKLLYPLGDEMEKPESFFYKPIGKKMRSLFQNEGAEPLILVSGKKTDFDVTELLAGDRKNIDIKKNSEGFEFGLCLPTVGAGGAAEEEYLATMFDAQQVTDGKLIKVGRDSDGYKVSIVLTDDTEHTLSNRRTKHYRESDRISRKDWLNWTVDIMKSAAKPVSALVETYIGIQ